jgi:hypothetical protein
LLASRQLFSTHSPDPSTEREFAFAGPNILPKWASSWDWTRSDGCSSSCAAPAASGRRSTKSTGDQSRAKSTPRKVNIKLKNSQLLFLVRRQDDLKTGNLIGEDKYGNKYFENNMFFYGQYKMAWFCYWKYIMEV